MAPTVTRLILSFALVIATPTLFFIMLFLGMELFDSWVNSPLDDTVIFGVITFFCVGMFGIGWILIWMGEVKWNPKRGMWTAVVLACGLFGWAIITAVFAATMPYEGVEIGLVFGGLVWIVWWLFGTALAWRETSTERAGRLAAMGVEALPCPSCSYNLSGLRESKCPECGAAFTLDQLYAAVDEQRRPMAGS